MRNDFHTFFGHTCKYVPLCTCLTCGLYELVLVGLRIYFVFVFNKKNRLQPIKSVGCWEWIRHSHVFEDWNVFLVTFFFKRFSTLKNTVCPQLVCGNSARCSEPCTSTTFRFSLICLCFSSRLDGFFPTHRDVFCLFVSTSGSMNHISSLCHKSSESFLPR